MSKWEDIRGFDYNTLAILGPQSSGKSTLLNGLFETTFPTMVGEDGRYQCTKGIWLGKSARSSTLVLDVEGTDGRERGESEVAFEKKTSLFSLALAEILIVNMWMQDVGRNNAANLPLLKTVFEINLQLFQHEKRSKTMLLFVVRDHVKQVTPLEKLVAIIEKDLAEIWAGIAKPEDHKNSHATDFFEFQFTSLPHKVLEADKFSQALTDLSRRFNDPNNAQYIWSQALKNNVPADGLAMFSEKVWEAIQANKDLDLPSQREILATFRCDEISASSLATFKSSLDNGLRASVVGRKQPVDDLGAQGDALIETALVSFNELASRYFADVVDRKRDALVASMLSLLKDVWNTNTALFFESATLAFEQSLQKTFRQLAKEQAAGNQTSDFTLTVEGLKKKALVAFQQRLEGSVPSRADWSFSLQVEQLETAMASAVEHEREKQLKLVMDQAFDAVEAYGDAVTDFLELGRPSMWKDIRSLFDEEASSGKEKELRGRLETLQVPHSDVEARLQEVSAKKMAVTRRRLELQQERVGQRMVKVFEEEFKMDGNMPRVWKPDTPIQSLYSAAVEKGADVLELYTVLRLNAADDKLKLLDDSDDHKVPAEKMLMTRSKADSILSAYKSATNNTCLEAQRSMDSFGKASSVPLLMGAAICILGFNEFIWLMSNPFMLLFVVTALTVAYAVHAMGLSPVVLPVVKAAYDQLLTQINAIINGGAAALQQGAASSASGAAASSSSSANKGKSKKE